MKAEVENDELVITITKQEAWNEMYHCNDRDLLSVPIMDREITGENPTLHSGSEFFAGKTYCSENPKPLMSDVEKMHYVRLPQMPEFFTIYDIAYVMFRSAEGNSGSDEHDEIEFRLSLPFVIRGALMFDIQSRIIEDHFPGL